MLSLSWHKATMHQTKAITRIYNLSTIEPHSWHHFPIEQKTGKIYVDLVACSFPTVSRYISEAHGNRWPCREIQNTLTVTTCMMTIFNIAWKFYLRKEKANWMKVKFFISKLVWDIWISCQTQEMMGWINLFKDTWLSE